MHRNLKDGLKIAVKTYDSIPVTASILQKLETRIIDCEPTVKEHTVSSSYK